MVQTGKTSRVKCEKSDAIEMTEHFNNLNFLHPIKADRGLSESLPKDIDRLSSGGRKRGTVRKPCQTEFFEQNEDEISPMIEKYRQ